jgi:transcriptional regulator with XRE-family HTH domain
MRFSENVAKIRNEHNFNITQLAAAIGVSRSTARRILDNRRGTNEEYTPTYNTVRKVANAVGLSTDDVFKSRIQFQST